MKAVVDTNFLINLIFEDQPFHKEAIEQWEKLEIAYVPMVVIFELAYFLTKYNQLQWLEFILSDEKIEIVETKLEDLYFALNQKPKKYDEFDDYIILSIALRLRVDLLTFDKELKEKFEKLKE